jgi:hypothetical protein
VQTYRELTWSETYDKLVMEEEQSKAAKAAR